MKAVSFRRTSRRRPRSISFSTPRSPARSAAEREAIKDRYATRRHVLNAADPLKAKAIDILRHYIVNILPNGFKAQLVAASRELAVEYVDVLVTARDEIVNAIAAAADILRALDPEAAQNAGGEIAFMAAALAYLDEIKRLEFAAVISIDHNDLPHLKAWGGGTETKQRLERFKKPLAQDPLAILVVKSKLLTGFDAKVEQAMYIDRAISGTELLQAIARTNRTSGETKRFGLVVDYYGVGGNLADALALYDQEDQGDLHDGIGKPEELLPELRQARDAVVKLFADQGVVRGSTLQPYVDACVSKLKEPETPGTVPDFGEEACRPFRYADAEARGQGIFWRCETICLHRQGGRQSLSRQQPGHSRDRQQSAGDARYLHHGPWD